MIKIDRPVAWEILAIAQIATMGFWLTDPVRIWGISAAILAGAAVVLAARIGRPSKVAIAVVGIAGSGAALYTSWQVNAVEERWADVRESLIQEASERLEATLADAVAMVDALAVRGASLTTQSRPEAFAILEGGLAGRSPERGVVLFDEGGQSWAWAGRLRLPAEPEGVGLRARMTPFYVVIEAERQVNGRTAVGQVVLAADSAVPNRDGTVAARFQRATGSSLDFFAPSGAPFGADVFDYCLPVCDAVEERPDTLFSVRPVPPAQGTLKLRLLDRGGRRVAFATATALAVLIVVSGSWVRWVSVLGAGSLLIFTPLGSRLGLEEFFSSGAYFLPGLAWLSASAGTLFVSAAILLLLATAVFAPAARRTAALVILAAIFVTGAPFLARYLAGGITPAATGVRVGAWIGWTLSISLAVTTFAVVGGLLLGRTDAPIDRKWLPWAAGAWAGLVGVLGFLTWRPDVGWPTWFPMIWVPAFVLAVLPARRGRLVTGTALVSGAAVALLAWAAVVEGRLVLAERDVERFGMRGDPFPIGFLEQFGQELRQESVPPRSAAELYAHWRRTPLSREDYPAILVTWDPQGREVARLELAELALQPEALATWARTSVGALEPILDEVNKVPGVHYVLSVPYLDGWVVTVAIGPRSRAIPPIRVARFLRGDRAGPAPYTMTLSDPLDEPVPGTAFEWRRTGTTVVADQPYEVVAGSRHLHVTLSVGSLPNLLIAGALLTLLNAAIVGGIWLLGEVLTGRLHPVQWLEGITGESFRTRLTAVLGVFFLVPTIGFAAWSIGRLRDEGDRARDLVINQTLRDAARTAFNFAAAGGSRARERLDEVAERLDADLILYRGGDLVHASSAVLAELGLLDAYMATGLYRRLVLEDGLTAITDLRIGGRLTRVGYRTMGGGGTESWVLASPMLVEESPGLADLYALLLALILGFATAGWLAARAANALAKPVRVLSHAAKAVGRGEPMPAFEAGMPKEFVPVASAFERMARDVRSHQEALEGALQFTEAVLRNVATGVVTLDRDMHVTTANPRAVALLEADPVSYQPVVDITAEAWLPVWQWVRRFSTSGTGSEAGEFTIDDKRVRVQVAALPGDKGGCVVVLDDATELAMAERVLAWGEMARQVAHEIKNPLTPMRLGIQHLLRIRRDRRGNFDDTLERTSAQILAEIERLDAIARAFSRFGAPPAEAGPLAWVNLAAVARETASLYALGEATSVVVDAAEEREALVRRDELKEVLVNLIENARAAGSTVVTIEIGSNGDSVAQVTVLDDGRGIPPENLPRIFEPHFSTTSSGTGLGLAICKRLVESWGGSIEAESDMGGGTRVSIKLEAPMTGS